MARFPIAGLLRLAFRVPSKPCFGNDKRNLGRLRCAVDGWEIRIIGLSGYWVIGLLGMGAALLSGGSLGIAALRSQ